jgi:hypothetical protein
MSLRDNSYFWYVGLILAGIVAIFVSSQYDTKSGTTTTIEPNAAEITRVEQELRDSGPTSLVVMNNDDIYAVRQVIPDKNTISLVVPQDGNSVIHRDITKLAPHVKRVVSPTGDKFTYAVKAEEYIRLSIGLSPATQPTPTSTSAK